MIKEQELKRKIKRNARRRLLKSWVTMRALHFHMVRTYQIVDREASVRDILEKSAFVVTAIKTKLKIILAKRGKDYDTRARRVLKNSMNVMGGAVLRPKYRERAKDLMHRYLSKTFEQHYLLSKVRKTYQ